MAAMTPQETAAPALPPCPAAPAAQATNPPPNHSSSRASFCRWALIHPADLGQLQDEWSFNAGGLALRHDALIAAPSAKGPGRPTRLGHGLMLDAVANAETSAWLAVRLAESVVTVCVDWSNVLRVLIAASRLLRPALVAFW